MQDLGSYFKGKKITVMGLGLLGRGVGDTKFLAERGADLIVTDLKTEAELQESINQLKNFPNIKFILGEHRLEDFKDRDYILKSADVPLDTPYIEEAKKNNIPIKMSASWFVELSGIKTIGITGTRGKSTVTHMLHDILKKAGEGVLLGGNVRGVSTLSLLPEAKENSVALMELDSWQCQGFGDSGISPNIAVFTTFYDDHLNYYGGDRKHYLKDKANIFTHQKPGDTFVVSDQARELIQELAPELKTQDGVTEVIVSVTDFPKWELKIPGEHNKLNAELAIEASRAYGIEEEVIREALKNFDGVPGRLELVKEINGVKIYNDTTATTPDASIAGIKALDTGMKNLILICGGTDKELDITDWSKLMSERCKRVVPILGSGTNKLMSSLGAKASRLPFIGPHGSLGSAFDEAWENADSGDVILFSPGFSSFEMFKNEYERGDQFNALVAKLS